MELNKNLNYVYLKSRMQNEFNNDNEYISIILKDALNGILKLCEEQEKEIEELKKPKFILNTETGTVTKIHNDFISKDKIKDKIKKLKTDCNICELEKLLDCNTQCTIGGTIKALNELLEEGEPDAK